VILPAASFAEKDGTFTNSDRRVQRVRKAVEPPGNARPDWEILSELARRTLRRTSGSRPGIEAIIDNWRYDHPSQIWDEMRALTPEFAGISYRRLEIEGGVHWPCPAVDHPGTPYLFAESFPRGRGKFWPVEYGTSSELPDEAYPYFLSTGRVLYQWHGGTMTRVSALDAAWPEATLEIHPADAARLGLGMGDWAEVSSRRGCITCRALVTGRSPEGTVFLPFHFAEAAANILTDNRLDLRAKIPDYKVCAVRVTRVADPPNRPGSDLPLLDRGAIKDPLIR
jgi:predicted molibdopterin-dependent oxidoreductase YjgC